MIKAETGLVLRYSYLWAREHDRGEESGRKTRPTCVQVIVSSQHGSEISLLFPITSQPPNPGTRALALPEMEAQRARIRLPAWVIVDEWNEEIDLERSFFIDDPKPLGAFSKAFMKRIREAAIEAIKAKRYRAIPR